MDFSLILCGEKNFYRTAIICNSKSARAYHASSDCRGLNRCKYDPEQVSEATAERRG